MPNYIESSAIKLTPRDRIFVDAEFYTGEKFENLEPDFNTVFDSPE